MSTINSVHDEQKLYPTQYSILRSAIKKNCNISAECKIYFGDLAVLSNANGYCFASDAQLAEMQGVAVITIKKWNHILEREGFIVRETTSVSYYSSDEKLRWKRKRKIFVFEDGNAHDSEIKKKIAMVYEDIPSTDGIRKHTFNKNKTIKENVRTFPASLSEEVKIPLVKDPPPDPEDSSLQEKLDMLCWVEASDSDKLAIAKGLQLQNLEKCLACYALNGTEVTGFRKWMFSCAEKKYWNSYDPIEIDMAISHNRLKQCLFIDGKQNDWLGCLNITKDKLCARAVGKSVSIDIHSMNFENIKRFCKNFNEQYLNTIVKWVLVPSMPNQSRVGYFNFKTI